MGDRLANHPHPRAVSVPIMGGDRHLYVRPWTMAQRSELRPLVIDLVTRFFEWQSKPTDVGLADILSNFEDQCAAIAEASVRSQLHEMNLVWDDLEWEDLPAIVQAVWQTSVVRPDGGGVGGKLLGLVQSLTGGQPATGASISDRWAAAVAAARGRRSQSETKTPNGPSAEPSRSSHDAGAPPPTN